jgi:leucyl-tRNA synthetase
MHKKFDHQQIEKKWQNSWKESGIYNAGDRDPKKEKEYILVELPYPSGNLHVGHWFAFAVTDMYVRTRRMQGKQVLFPMGFDAFGLPAENAAIKRGLDPKAWTESNIEYMKTQLASMGNAFSWDKTTSSTDPEYYRWTQWMFTEFFKKGIAYQGTGKVNWCPGCNTVLANEQVLGNNTCERSGDVIEQREMKQWMLRITDYADRLIDDLDALDWPEPIKESQRNWIGRKEGARIPFTLTTGDTVDVFTTRPDTLFGATFLVLAPEHPLLKKLSSSITNLEEVHAYQALTRTKRDEERMAEGKEKTGVCLNGVTAVNPASKEEIPVFIADYVIGTYGTGALMGVPAHDERDFAFANTYAIDIIQTIVPCEIDSIKPPLPEYPEIARNTVVVHLRDKSTGKYALLEWKGPQSGITTAIMGGIEDGQNAEEAALREIDEEAGIPNARIVKTSPWVTSARYCASHKKENRHALCQVFLAEVDDLSEQKVVSSEEDSLHSLIWVDEKSVSEELVPHHQKMLWESLNADPAPLLDSGYLTHSGAFDGMDSEEAKAMIAEFVGGKLENTYRLRDWSIGRQRYWGVPVPIVYDPEGNAHPIPEEHLPWLLPTDVDHTPTGEPPLSKSKELHDRVTGIFGEGWTPDYETMDTFVDSSWYFLRYIDAENETVISSKTAQEAWMPVDTYFGGAEHTTMHLLYSRFWQKALFDLGLAVHEEPYKKRINRGLVLGPDGNKMSKSKGNVIDPDVEVARLGADTVRMYLAFMGPYGEVTNYPWDINGIVGIRRFLERVYGLREHVTDKEDPELMEILHKTILKVTKDVELYKFNTAISSLMIFLNAAEKAGLGEESYKTFLRLLAPFAPHLTEELWSNGGMNQSIHTEEWPQHDASRVASTKVMIAVQINGKTKGTVETTLQASESDVRALVETMPNLSVHLGGGVERVIYVPGRILNFVTPKT